ncbi:hypothetical protein EMCG_00655 [[Emmonsia] crescens]|uniref:Uncharacterized protein n=1 Tax=[Emmonsia] crescens TaxID=73230 RepID=A0A0G2IYV2_9EURO|nr:hypothetical protein EMCG_00655 [Emmonsia crescens UAMH 3008]
MTSGFNFNVLFKLLILLYTMSLFSAHACGRFLRELHEDCIRYVDFRLVFDFPYRRDRHDEPESDYEAFFQAFDEDIYNDDLTLLGYGKNGLTHDFCQVLNGLENVGLVGLATKAENSFRWSCFEDPLKVRRNGYSQGRVSRQLA